MAIGYGCFEGLGIWGQLLPLVAGIAATPSTFALSISAVGSGAFTTGEAGKQAGKNFTPNGTWQIVNTGPSKSEACKLYSQDGPG